MKRFVFREARILALRKQEVSLAEVRVAKAAEQVEAAQRIVDADQTAIDELSSSLLGSEANGLTIIDHIALGMRARLETSRQKLFERQQALAAAEKEAADKKSRDEIARQAENRAIGRASTILTGGRGLMEDDTNAKSYLL